jgi:hypothetical protein
MSGVANTLKRLQVSTVLIFTQQICLTWTLWVQTSWRPT